MRPRHHSRRLRLTVFVVLLSLPWAVTSGRAGLYVSWDRLEADKLASVWLIKRFIDPDAAFRFQRAGSAITSGTPFDVPGARLQRRARETTFDAIRRLHHLDDPALDRLALYIRDLELNLWTDKRYPESREIDGFVKEQAVNPDPQAVVTATLAFFDDLFHRIRKKD